MILLNPGPVNLTTAVRQSLHKPDLCHREPEYLALQDTIRTKLLDLYTTPKNLWSVALLGGSGTAAIEASITTLHPHKALVLCNGVYGERMAKIATTYRINHQVLNFGFENPIDIEKVEKTLKHDGPFSHICLVHHETTTGRLNPLEPIGELCRRYNTEIILDAVSSFGAETIDFSIPIAVCAGTANKCLHGIPGLSFALIARAALKSAQQRPKLTFYLDLENYVTSQEAHNTPFTPPIHCCYALECALDEYNTAGGQPQRYALFKKRSLAVRAALEAQNVQALLPWEENAVSLQAFYLPKGYTYQSLHDAMKKRGYVIYAGQHHLAQNIFRIAVMGDIQPNNMEHLIQNAIPAVFKNKSDS